MPYKTVDYCQDDWKTKCWHFTYLTSLAAVFFIIKKNPIQCKSAKIHTDLVPGYQLTDLYHHFVMNSFDGDEKTQIPSWKIRTIRHEASRRAGLILTTLCPLQQTVCCWKNISLTNDAFFFATWIIIREENEQCHPMHAYTWKEMPFCWMVLTQ